MKVLFTTRTIEVTKTFAEKAAHFGSEEYQMLRAATKDFPEFQVVIKTVCRKKVINESDRLTYARMMDCLSACDGSEKLVAEFVKLREYGCNYGQIRKWFLTNFPELNNFAA